MATRLRPSLTDALDDVLPAFLRKYNRRAGRLRRLRREPDPAPPPLVREARQLCASCYGTGVTMGFDGRRGHVRPYACRCGAPYELPAMMQRIVDYLEGREAPTAVERGLYDHDYDERMQA